MEKDIINHIEDNLLNCEDKLKYLLDVSFIYETSNIKIYNYIFYKTIEHLNKVSINMSSLKFFDKVIILKSLYYFYYCDKKSLSGPLTNLMYVLSNYNSFDTVDVADKMIDDYLEQMKLLVMYFENRLGEKNLRLSL